MTADSDSLSVLVVDDNPADRDLVAARLDETRGAFHLSFAASLASAVGWLEQNSADVVLLDLGLPDSQGIETFRRLHAKLPGVPVVVMTGLDSDAIGIEAVQGGAQDYLVKGHTGAELLTRSLRYAVERHRLRGQLESERSARELEREELSLRAMSPRAPVVASLYGRKPISEAAPEVFDGLVATYGELLDAALECQIKRTDEDVPGRLRELAERMGTLAAGPRDVVEMHRQTLRTACARAVAAKARALTEEGRFRVLELMGHLASYYRRYAVGAEPDGGTPNNASVTGRRIAGRGGRS